MKRKTPKQRPVSRRRAAAAIGKIIEAAQVVVEYEAQHRKHRLNEEGQADGR